jgi:aminoglycoside phosphotransferase (APT) family kinase protein
VADGPLSVLIGTGRTADVFDAGPGRVLRRYRDPNADAAYEAEVMRYVRSCGFPVPQVYGAAGPELVMERVSGPTMAEVLVRNPWDVVRLGDLLADLHEQLHAIAAPSWMAPAFGPGGSVLHLDFHLTNVIITERGAVVIDWKGARRGPAAADVANTWLLLATSGRFGQAWWAATARSALLRGFLKRFPADELRAALPAVAQRRVSDPSVGQRDRIAVARLLKKLALDL